MTTMITQAIKTMVESAEFPKNLLAGIVSVVVGLVVSIFYLILNHMPMTPETAVYIIILIVLSWLCAMLGYDKVIQTLTQIKKK